MVYIVLKLINFKTDTLKCILFSCPQFAIQFSLSVTFHLWIFELPSVWAIQCQVLCEEDSQDTIFLYTCFFLSKQLFKAQRYILIHSEDLATQVAVALWRTENKPTLSDQAERKGHVGRLGQQKEAGIHEWSRNGPAPHFRSPICGAGCLSIHETKSSETDIAASGCELRVCGKGMLMVRNTHDDHAGRNNRTAESVFPL